MRRKWLVLWNILCLALCMMLGPMGMEEARAGVQGDYSYEYWEPFYAKGTVEITGYTGSDTELVIPEKIDGYTVAGIGFKAFKDCKSLRSVEVPSGVKRINWCAFSGCSNLERMKLPAGLDVIEDEVFLGCSSLSEIELPSGVSSIWWGAFEGCSSLERMKLPAGLTSITGMAFARCDRLEGIDVDAGNPNYQSVDGVLYSKDGKELIYCPAGKAAGFGLLDGVEKIGAGAFSGCSNLKSIQIPAGVEIEVTGLRYCDSLTEINVDAGHSDYKSEDGILYSKDGTELLCCPAGKTDGIHILPSVHTICSDAFSGCKISSLELPPGVVKIESSAFAYCSNLSSISIPAGVTDMIGYVFAYCDNLKEIHVDANNPYFASVDGILYNKDKTILLRYPSGRVDEVKFLDSVTEIGFFAFYGCTNLKYLELPSGITKIGWNAFAYCSSLREIKLPAGLTSIKSGAFSNCTSLTSIEIPQGVTEIEGETFLTCENLASITIPVSVTGIELDMFSYYNPSLKDVYYAGSEEQWKKIGLYNDFSLPLNFDKATIHYKIPSSEEPVDPPAPEKPTEPNVPDKPTNPTTPDTPTANVTVSFDSQGGSKISDINVAKGGSLSYIPVPTRSGYYFQGWYTGTNGTGSLLTLGTAIGKNVTYYAYWTSTGRSVTGITVSVSGTPYTGSSVSSVLNVRAWYSDGTSGQVYDYSVSQPVFYSGYNTVTVTYYGFTQQVTVQANAAGTNAAGTDTGVWNLLVSYTGGSLPVGTYGTFGGLTVRAAYADGTTQEVFGYALSTHSIVKGNNRVTVMYGGKTADFYLTGYEYLAVQMANAAGIPDILVSEGAKLPAVLQNIVPSKSGYYFGGWYLDAACTKKVTAQTDAAAGTKVYAKWEKIYHWALNKTKATVKKGKQVKLSVAGLSNSKITWKTSDSTIARVSKQGIVKGIKKGTAIITAVTKDGTVMTCTVQVKK